MGKASKNKEKKISINEENLNKGIKLIDKNTLFSQLYGSILCRDKDFMGDLHAIVSSDGYIYVNKDTNLSPNQWAHAIAHCFLHLAFGHFDLENLPYNFNKYIWNAACDIYITKFLSDIKFGEPLTNTNLSEFNINLTDEIKIYNSLISIHCSESTQIYSTASKTHMDMDGLEKPIKYNKTYNQFNRYSNRFAYALANSVSNAVGIAGGHVSTNSDNNDSNKAASWFISHYPLLGGVASHFKVIEDYNYCMRNDIQVAAIDVTSYEIYVNPTASLSEEELKFVLAHEYLHAGLQHHERCQGRDSYLWNISCDYVINSWLHEMQIGQMPEIGLLYDESLKNLSAETIYDMIIINLKKYSKLNTFRGYGKGDIISNNKNSFSKNSGVSLDDFCKDALMQGLEYHLENNRGYIPSGLIEEIRALSMPPIPWDVELAKWFDCFFAPLEKHRSYSRLSRRQSSTPNIPRPRYILEDINTEGRTFGVVLDTSGSMNSKQLGMALGSIASYAAAKDVPLARVIFCDAAAYDAGYLSLEDIAGRLKVQGRGGTVLQPGIDLIENAKDFPKDGPILIITDGYIEDKLVIKHNHAFLIPKGNRLPFRAKGPVFYFCDR